MNCRTARKMVLGAAMFAGAMICGSSLSHAQYGTSFYYSNPRTGFSYSQNVGTGTQSAYGGFSYSRNGRSASAGSGYYGNNYYQHQYRSTPSYQYGYQSQYGRGYYQGGSSYSR